MGFRTGAYCTVWDVDPKTDTFTKVRLSVSKKNKATGEYETEFSGFVSFVGTATAKKAAALKPKDRIKLGDVDVTNIYDNESKREYVNYKCFNFETDGGRGSVSPEKRYDDPQPANVDAGDLSDERLPF